VSIDCDKLNLGWLAELDFWHALPTVTMRQGGKELEDRVESQQ
jgi:hypothetical protein